jgi:D-cysteine desulfhydrase
MLPLLALLADPPPRLSLGTFPSPVESHPELASALGFDDITIKREDQNAAELGGNKLRALEWILPSTRSEIVSMGGFGSTYAATLAWYAGLAGRRVSLALFPQPWLDFVPATLGRTLERASVFLAPSMWSLPLAVGLAWRHAAVRGPVSWVSGGGATPLGVLGSINAALEFVAQVEVGGADRPDLLVAPLGSGGTIAGLLIGCWLARWNVCVCGVRVASRVVANRLQVSLLVKRTCRLLREKGLKVDPGTAKLLVLTGHFGRGYGVPTAEARAMQQRLREHGVTLELTYGAKTFAALSQLAGSYRRPVFWHTFDSRIAGPPADTPLLHQAHAYSESLWPLPKSN